MPTTRNPAAADDLYPLIFTGCRETVYLTRDLVRTSLGRWGLNAYESDASQIMSELASNAARLCEGVQLRAWVSRIDAGVELCVWDNHPDRPEIQQPHQFGTSGRGLIIVKAFATGGCGWVTLYEGKIVWARIAIDEQFMRAAAIRVGAPIVGPLLHVDRPRSGTP